MTAPATTGLHLLASNEHRRASRDRLELLTALVNGPSVEDFLRADIIEFPPAHPVYGWQCLVAGCERPAQLRLLCHAHNQGWKRAHGQGVTREAFIRSAEPLKKSMNTEPCRICPDRPSNGTKLRLCWAHRHQWYVCQRQHRLRRSVPDWEQFLAGRQPLPGYGPCRTRDCPELAWTPLGLCEVSVVK